MLVTCIYSITDITRCRKFPKRQLNEIILVLVTKTKMIVPNRFAENLGWGGGGGGGGMLAWNDIELKTNHDQRYFLFSSFNGWILIFNTSLKSKEMLNVLIFTSLQIWALDAFRLVHMGKVWYRHMYLYKPYIQFLHKQKLSVTRAVSGFSDCLQVFSILNIVSSRYWNTELRQCQCQSCFTQS